MIHFVTASSNNKDASRHFETTILNKVDLKNYKSYMDTNTLSEIAEVSLDLKVNMWGATPGKNNIPNWTNIKLGDVVLIYVGEKFSHYGIIYNKIENHLLAKEIWGIDKEKNATWKYIIFIKDLKQIDLNILKFNAFFGYSSSFHPNGFNHISKERLKTRLKKYSNSIELIEDLTYNYPISDDELSDNFQEAINSKETNKVSAEYEPKPEKRKSTKKRAGINFYKRDRTRAQRALKRVNFKCEIDNEHETFQVVSSNHSFMEAHHLIPFKEQHFFSNNIDVESNIVSLCPNCHRMIHLAKTKIKNKMISHLYNERKSDLALSGIGIELKDLLEMY